MKEEEMEEEASKAEIFQKLLDTLMPFVTWVTLLAFTSWLVMLTMGWLEFGLCYWQTIVGVLATRCLYQQVTR